MALVICEKNDAAKRIASILSDNRAKAERLKGSKIPIYTFKYKGETWQVVGLRGHVMELDYPKERWSLDDLPALIHKDPVTKVKAWDIARVLKALAPHNKRVIIATDYDREGELIGVEALDILKEHIQGCEVKRAKFSTLTPDEIRTSFNNLVEVDHNLATSAEARREIDLAWGAVLTRFLTLITPNNSGVISAGRVQTPTLAIVVERDREIENFVPEPYWQVIAYLKKGEGEFEAKHHLGNIKKKEDAERVLDRVMGATTGIIAEVKSYEVKERPPHPFDTTTFLAEASKYLNMRPDRALEVAERLYMGGYISYPRTDNTVYPPSTPLRSILDRLKIQYSDIVSTILNMDHITPSRGKKESKDHPPIHPLFLPEKGKVSAEEWKVYDLIARRFLATLSPPCVLGISDVDVDINGEMFKARGVVITSPGWRKAYHFEKKEERPLPDLIVGEKVEVLDIKRKDLKTKPPPHLTHAELLRIMEKLGIGTKSTRADMIQKIITRRYVKGRTLVSTAVGRALIEALERHAAIITKPDMTSKLERDMELIKEGKMTKEGVKKESYEALSMVLSTLMEHKEAIASEISEAIHEDSNIGTCPECGGALVIRHNKKDGKRFIGCSNYPTCKVTYSLPQKGTIYKTDRVCKECGAPLVRLYIHGRKRSKLICPNYKCPTNRAYWDNRKGSEGVKAEVPDEA